MPVAQGWCWKCHAEGSYWQSLTGQSGDLACGEMTLRKVRVTGSSSRDYNWLQPWGIMMGKILPVFLGGPVGLIDQLHRGWGGEQGVGAEALSPWSLPIASCVVGPADTRHPGPHRSGQQPFSWAQEQISAWHLSQSWRVPEIQPSPERGSGCCRYLVGSPCPSPPFPPLFRELLGWANEQPTRVLPKDTGLTLT